jgi:hypothetical protein
MKVIERIIGNRIFLEVVPDDYEEEPPIPDPSAEGSVTVLVPDSYYER